MPKGDPPSHVALTTGGLWPEGTFMGNVGRRVDGLGGIAG